MDGIAGFLVQHPEVALFLAFAIGDWFGAFTFGGFSFGPVTGSLFAGILIGQFADIPARPWRSRSSSCSSSSASATRWGRSFFKRCAGARPDLVVEVGDVVAVSGPHEAIVGLVETRAEETEDEELLSVPFLVRDVLVSERALAGRTGCRPGRTSSALRESGLSLLLGGAVVTLTPLIVGLYLLRINPVLLLGALAGALSMTAAIAAVQVRADGVAVFGYPPADPVAQILLPLSGTLIVVLIAGPA
jgi:uncharacterized transporter YbjL